MKTDNFDIQFLLDDKIPYTFITFGYTEVRIYYYPDLDSYGFFYNNNGKVKLSLCSDLLPKFLLGCIEKLYYGFFAFNPSEFNRSRSMEVVSVVRSIQNYCKRTKTPFVCER